MKNVWKKVIILITLSISSLLYGCGSQAKAEALADFAKEQFLNNDKDAYVDNLRNKTGLSDIDVEINILYNYDYNYDKRNRELSVEGHLTFLSDEIDKYYNPGDKEEDLKELDVVMNKIRDVYEEKSKYIYKNNKGTVYLNITDGTTDNFYVRTSSGREYQFTYMSGYDDIEVDGELVYIETNKEHTPSTSSSTSNSYTGSYDAKLRYSGTDGVLICASEDVMDRFMTALANNNQGTLDELFSSGQCGYTEQGTKCNIVDEKITKCKVKLLDGSYAGNTVWVVIEAVQKE